MIPNSVAPNTSGYPQGTTILASFDSIRPDFQKILFEQFGDQFSKEMRLLYDMNAKRAMKNATGGFHFEEDRFDTSITVKANAGTSGTTLSFTLADDEIEVVSGERTSYPNVGDLIWNPYNGQKFEILTKTDNGTNTTITATEINGQTAEVPSAGVQYGIYSAAYAENSGQPDARASYWTKINFVLQRVKTTGLVTGDAAGNELFPEYDESGNFVGNWLGFTRMRTEWEHLKKIAGTIVLGDQGTQGQSTTNGMMSQFAARANTLDISGGVDVDSLRETVDLLKPNSTPSNVIGLLTRQINRPLQEDLQQDLQNANIEQVRRKSAELIFGRGESSEGMMVTYDFNTTIIDGFTFNLRLFDLSYEPNTFGLGDPTLNQFTNTAYFMPSSRTVDAQDVTRRYMEMNYLSNAAGNVDRLMKVWELGANASTPTNDIDNLTINFLSQVGLDFFAMKQCAYWYNATLS